MNSPLILSCFLAFLFGTSILRLIVLTLDIRHAPFDVMSYVVHSMGTNKTYWSLSLNQLQFHFSMNRIWFTVTRRKLNIYPRLIIFTSFHRHERCDDLLLVETLDFHLDDIHLTLLGTRLHDS